MPALTVLLAVLAALTNGAASVLQRRAMVERSPAAGSPVAGEAAAGKAAAGQAGPRRQPTRGERVAKLLRNRWWLGGMGAMALSGILQVAALATGPMAVVQPLLASELLFTLVVGVLVFPHRPAPRTWAMFGMLALGLALFLAAANPLPGVGSASGRRWLVAGLSAALLVAVLVPAAVALPGEPRAALAGCAAAVGFACAAALIKECTARLPAVGIALLADWPPYALAAAGISGFLLLQYALRSGSLAASQPALTLVDAAVSTALGWALFAERIHLGLRLVPEILGMALVGAGVVGLTRTGTALSAWDRRR